MDEERYSRRCCSHNQTMDEISQLKEENRQIREELNEVKRVLHSFKEFEDAVIQRYRSRHKTLWEKIMMFFKGE